MNGKKNPEVKTVSKKGLNAISGGAVGANVKTEFNDSATISRTIGDASKSDKK